MQCTACESTATHSLAGHEWCQRHFSGYMTAALVDPSITPARYVWDGATIETFRPETQPTPQPKRPPMMWQAPVVLPPGASTESGRPRFRSRSWVTTTQRTHHWRTANV